MFTDYELSINGISKVPKNGHSICSTSGALWEEWLARSGRWGDIISWIYAISIIFGNFLDAVSGLIKNFSHDILP